MKNCKNNRTIGSLSLSHLCAIVNRPYMRYIEVFILMVTSTTYLSVFPFLFLFNLLSFLFDVNVVSIEFFVLFGTEHVWELRMRDSRKMRAFVCVSEHKTFYIFFVLYFIINAAPYYWCEKWNENCTE